MPSGRMGRVPTEVKLRAEWRGSKPILCSLHHARGVLYGPHNLVVAGAAAEVSGKSEADLFLGRIGVPGQQVLRRHQKSRRADAALQRRVFEEFLLQRMQSVAARHALDR